MNQGKRLIPYMLKWDDSPVDISFVFENERPAGRHGFLGVKKDRLVFEDGAEAIFWGTNFNGGANFPSHEYSEKTAKRLAKFGVNLVRLHQLDAEWSTPNIFQFSKGRRKLNTSELDPESMEKLDYLVFCLKREGIYIYMDMLTYRKFKSGDGVTEAEKLNESAKPYSIFDSHMIELQKDFNQNLWIHLNPYTGLAYKDDPVFVLTEVTNESDLFWYERSPVILEPYRTNLEEKYRKWADERNIPISKEKVDFTCQKEPVLEFLQYVQMEYYREIIGHLRKLGVKIPVTGTNWPVNAALLSCQLITDFTDSHAYWNALQWSADSKKFDNSPMVAETTNFLPILSFGRVLDKPFFASEWDEPWPNEWRAESPLLVAAAGAFQGWSGIAVHTYRYNTLTEVDKIGMETTSGALGGVYYRGGLFDTFNDPAKFGLFYHAALILRRGDVREAEHSLGICIEDMSLGINASLKKINDNIPALILATEKHKVGMVLPGRENTADIGCKPEEASVDISKGEVLSDTGELYRNWEGKYGWIDTPRTKAVYGFTGGPEEIKINGLKLNVRNDFATIAISSLTDEPLSKSGNVLLTVIGRTDNAGSQYNEDHTVQISLGTGPVMIEVIEAAIELKTEQKNLKAWAVNDDGFFIGAIPSKYEDGLFKFEVGGEFQSMYYLIQAQ